MGKLPIRTDTVSDKTYQHERFIAKGILDIFVWDKLSVHRVSKLIFKLLWWEKKNQMWVLK